MLEISYTFNYFITIFYVGFSLILSLFLLFFSVFLRYTQISLPDLEMSSSYECGFLPFDRSRTKVEVKFFMIALLFVIFDLEIIFIYPWSLCLTLFSGFQVFFMIIFLTVLVFSFMYEWQEKALNF